MEDLLLNKKDIEQLNIKNITYESLIYQLSVFKKEQFYENIVRPCTVGDGITVLNDKEIKILSNLYNDAAPKRNPVKFVPASGAATRMFHFLHAVDNGLKQNGEKYISDCIHKNSSEFTDFIRFVENINRFAFYEDLKKVMLKKGLDIEDIILKKQYQYLTENILYSQGLGYGGYPKGMILFHRYKDRSRTPFEEHLAEASGYAKDAEGYCRVHFTVSSKHHNLISNHIKTNKVHYEKSGTTFDVSLSFQQPYTDTIAVDEKNRPFRDKNNRLVFRPGGHGALIENLNNLEADIVFIENIDNVCTDRLKKETLLYKTAIGGYLIGLQEEIFRYLSELVSGKPDAQNISKMFEFAKDRLCITLPDGIENKVKDEQIEFLISKFNRPLRVCGMVKNVSAPGGGPFWVRGRDGSISLQIVENAQIDHDSKKQLAILEASTHFNPVNIVCGITDFKNRPFDLRKYIDNEAVFISFKSKNGKPLKALELPGLWNGAMAYWNTVFIELPVITFNPVKKVLDLLNKAHQS